MWSWCARRGRKASLTSTYSKNYPSGTKWEAALTNLWAPLLSLSRLLAAQDHAQNLEERLWTGVHQLMGSCFEWRGGRKGVLFLTDVWIAAIWSEKGRFFVGVSQHFCVWLKLSLTTLPKLNLETSIPVRPSGWYFIFFTASKLWKPST